MLMAEVVVIGAKDRDRAWTIKDMLDNGDVRIGMSNSVKERFECYAIALQNSFLSVGEVRKLEGLPDDPEV